MTEIKKEEKIGMSFNEQKQMVKGDFGELIVDEYYSQQGITIYLPSKKESHLIDRFYIKGNLIRPVDIKTKPKRDLYADTGFDIEDYKKYVEIRTKYRLEPRIIFVDEKLGYVYGNSLAQLENKRVIKYASGRTIEYPFISMPDTHGKIQVYFPIKNMRKLFKLSDNQISVLKSLKAEYDAKDELTKEKILEIFDDASIENE